MKNKINLSLAKRIQLIDPMEQRSIKLDYQRFYNSFSNSVDKKKTNLNNKLIEPYQKFKQNETNIDLK